MNVSSKRSFKSINDIFLSGNVVKSNQTNSLVYSILCGNIDLKEVEEYLKEQKDRKITDYRKILCAYDYMKYKDESDTISFI